MPNLGEVIREKRREYQLTQAGLAKKVGVSDGYIGILEIGRQTPSLKTLIKIARVLNLDIEEATSLGLSDIFKDVRNAWKQKEQYNQEFERLKLKTQKFLLEIAPIVEKYV